MLEFKNVSGKNSGFNLDNITFTVPDGYITGITGSNGAGKTTLLNYITDENQKFSGQILYNGIDITKNRRWFLNKTGFISDDNKFFMSLTADSNVEILSELFENWDNEKYIFYMKKYKVSRGRVLAGLSRGEYIKFQYAFAMAHNAQLLIMDEVTGGMDPVFRKDFFREMREFIISEENTIIMTTHISEEIEHKLDFIGLMDAGRLISYQSNDEEYEESAVFDNHDNVNNSENEEYADMAFVNSKIEINNESNEENVIKNFKLKYKHSNAVNYSIKIGGIICEIISYLFILYPTGRINYGDREIYMFIALSSMLMLCGLWIQFFTNSFTSENGENVLIYEKLRYMPVNRKIYKQCDIRKIITIATRMAVLSAGIQIISNYIFKCFNMYMVSYIILLTLLLESSAYLFSQIGYIKRI